MADDERQAAAAEAQQEEEEADVGPSLPPEGAEGAEEEEEGADVGPVMPKAKKRKVLEYEQQYLAALPLPEMYEKSYMHRDTVTQVAVAAQTEFFITGSADGHIKFWKKQPQGIEFAKHYKAHLGPVTGLAVSGDGTLCASISTDRTAKVFDVASFDMIAMLRLPWVPGCVEWCFRRGDAKAKLAVSDSGSGAVHIYDMRSGSNDALDTLPSLHAAPVTAMRYNEAADTVISSDGKGVIEYWSAVSGTQGCILVVFCRQSS
jgi:peptidylprolyl isomerase domain and WD repeat-containing protein 1